MVNKYNLSDKVRTKIHYENDNREEVDAFIRGIELVCIFRKNRALAPHERSAVPLGTDHCPVG